MKRPLLQRACSFLLALMFIWDIGFHLIAPLYASLETASAVTSIGAGSGTDTHPDCGFPDHECALSHHHHFPALVSTSQFVVASVTITREMGTLPTLVAHRSTSSRLIRAPPVVL